MLARQLTLLWGPLSFSAESLRSRGVLADGLRAFTSSSSWQRITREPTPPTRAPGVAEEAEKPNLVDKFLATAQLPRRERERVRRRDVLGSYERFQGDTGSTEVQVALLTEKIKSLAVHMTQHKKDYSSRRGLEAMLNQRRKLLVYLRRTKFDVYAALISRLGLKDNYAPQDRYTSRYKAADRGA